MAAHQILVFGALLLIGPSAGGRPAPPAVGQKQQQKRAPQQQGAPPAAPVDAGRRSLATLRIATGLVAFSLSLVVLSPTPALIAAVGTERATSMIQWVAAASAGTEVVLSPLVGSLVDALGRKPLLVLALCLLSLAQALVACTGSVGSILLANFASSFLFGVFMLSAGAATADLLVATPERLAAETAVGMTVLTGGLALGVPLSSALPARLGAKYGASAALSLCGALVLSARMGETLPATDRRAFEPRLALRSPLACARLFRRSRRLALLSALLGLQLLPLFAGDMLQVHSIEQWKLTDGQRTRLFTLTGLSAVGANALASGLIRTLGLRAFTALAGLSHAFYWAGVSHSGRAALLSAVPAVLGGARALGVSTQLTAEGARAGVRQGELAGERANLFALLKVVGPILYAQLYAKGRALGCPQLPFALNCALMLAAAGMSFRLLPAHEEGGGAPRAAGEPAAARKGAARHRLCRWLRRCRGAR